LSSTEPGRIFRRSSALGSRREPISACDFIAAIMTTSS
jgi:hypothetical protein